MTITDSTDAADIVRSISVRYPGRRLLTEAQLSNLTGVQITLENGRPLTVHIDVRGEPLITVEYRDGMWTRRESDPEMENLHVTTNR